MPYVTLYSQIGQRKPMSSRLLTTTALFATVKCPKSHKSSVGEGLNKQTHVPVTGVEQKLLHMRGYKVLSTAVKEQHRSIHIMHLGRFIKRMLSRNKNNSNNTKQNQNSGSEFMGVAN